MCRNITELRGLEPPATHEEIDAAAMQFVRKITGVTKPNAEVAALMHAAAHQIAHISADLLAEVPAAAPAPPRCRRCAAPRCASEWASRVRPGRHGRIAVDIGDHIATVTLERPPVNAVDTDTFHEIRDAFPSLDDDRDVPRRGVHRGRARGVHGRRRSEDDQQAARVTSAAEITDTRPASPATRCGRSPTAPCR